MIPHRGWVVLLFVVLALFGSLFLFHDDSIELLPINGGSDSASRRRTLGYAYGKTSAYTTSWWVKTPQPQTLKPQTPQPQTLKPQTAQPQTLKPQTPQPQAPSLTLKPQTPQPTTPRPTSQAPVQTPRPTTQPPVPTLAPQGGGWGGFSWSAWNSGSNNGKAFGWNGGGRTKFNPFAEKNTNALQGVTQTTYDVGQVDDKTVLVVHDTSCGVRIVGTPPYRGMGDRSMELVSSHFEKQTATAFQAIGLQLQNSTVETQVLCLPADDIATLRDARSVGTWSNFMQMSTVWLCNNICMNERIERQQSYINDLNADLAHAKVMLDYFKQEVQYKTSSRIQRYSDGYQLALTSAQNGVKEWTTEIKNLLLQISDAVAELISLQVAKKGLATTSGQRLLLWKNVVSEDDHHRMLKTVAKNMFDMLKANDPYFSDITALEITCDRLDIQGFEGGADTYVSPQG